MSLLLIILLLNFIISFLSFYIFSLKQSNLFSLFLLMLQGNDTLFLIGLDSSLSLLICSWLFINFLLFLLLILIYIFILCYLLLLAFLLDLLFSFLNQRVFLVLFFFAVLGDFILVLLPFLLDGLFFLPYLMHLFLCFLLIFFGLIPCFLFFLLINLF